MGKVLKKRLLKDPANFIKDNIIVLFTFILTSLLFGSFGSVFTLKAIPTWYLYLNKPSFNPPNWIFGPVWTFLYITMGIAVYLIWRVRSRIDTANDALKIFGIQFVFNILWSYLFFGLRSPLYGLIGIIALWITVVLTMIYFYRVQKIAAYVLVPYFIWISFASILNVSIYLLN